jgi:uncharacterized membrane protein YfhO
MIDQYTIQNIADILNQRVAEVRNGRTHAVELYAYLYELEKLVKESKDDIQGLAFEEVEQYGKQGLDYGDYKMTAVQTTRWVYKDAELDRYKALMKARQDLMKQSAKIMGGLADQYGEEIPPAEPRMSQSIKMEYRR